MRGGGSNQRCSIVIAAILVAGGGVLSQAADFQVNTYTSDNQQYPAIDVVKGGGTATPGEFVVVWESNGQVSGYDIFGQRFDQTGAKQGGEIPANSTTAGNQREPAIAVDADGNFVVVWAGPLTADPDGAISAQVFDNTGSSVISEFRVNQATSYPQSEPAVSMDPSGNFVVVWRAQYPDGYIYSRSFDSLGTGGSEYRVGLSAYYGSQPDVALDQSGNFVVVWRDYYYTGGSYYDIVQRRYDSGTGWDSGLVVNSDTGAYHNDPSVSLDGTGAYIVVWGDPQQEGNGTSGVYAQRFNASGSKLGGNFHVNSSTGANEQRPDVATDGSGNFLVAWEAVPGGTPPGELGSGIFGQLFTSSGTKSGGEVHINTYTTGDQRRPRVGGYGDQEFWVVWDSAGQDGSGTGVFGAKPDLCDTGVDDPTPTDPTVCEGGSVVFAVNATGTGPFSYQWKKDGGDLTGETSDTLTIDPVAPGDAGDYTCVVTSTCAVVTSNATTLTVTAAPAVTIAGPTETCEGQLVQLDAGGGFSSYSWSTGASTQTINVTPASTTTYTVTVTDGGGCSGSDSHLLTVIPYPADIGNSVRVTKTAGGNPLIKWSDTGADDYVVYEDTAASGTFSTVTGTEISGATGVEDTVHSGNLFYLVAARNGTCEGPK